MQESGHRGEKAVNIGLAVNVILALVKTFIGIIGHSAALLADGVNSTSDVAYYIVVKVFMKLADKPADKEHPYGHRQLESIAALVVGAFVVTTAIAIFWDSINNVYDILMGRQAGGVIQLAALWVALLTVVIKIVLTYFTRHVGVQAGNAAVLALASDHRNDAWSAGGAAVGILLGRSGFAWGDPLAGAIVAIIILQTGIEILRESSADLMDTVPGESLDRQVRDLLKENSDVKEVEEVLAHRFGPYLVINVQIAVDGKLSLAEGDAIAERVEKRLSTEIELVRRVYVHYHPVRSLRSQ